MINVHAKSWCKWYIVGHITSATEENKCILQSMRGSWTHAFTFSSFCFRQFFVFSTYCLTFENTLVALEHTSTFSHHQSCQNFFGKTVPLVKSLKPALPASESLNK